MKKFKNKNTGIVEIVTNEKIIKQYENHSEVYEEIKETKKNDKPKADKTAESKNTDKKA